MIRAIEGVAVDAEATERRVDPSAFGRLAAIGDVELADRLVGVFLSDADGRAAQVDAAIGARETPPAPGAPWPRSSASASSSGRLPCANGCASSTAGSKGVGGTDDPGWEVLNRTDRPGTARRGNEGTPAGGRGDPRLARARRQGWPRAATRSSRNVVSRTSTPAIARAMTKGSGWPSSQPAAAANAARRGTRAGRRGRGPRGRMPGVAPLPGPGSPRAGATPRQEPPTEDDRPAGERRAQDQRGRPRDGVEQCAERRPQAWPRQPRRCRPAGRAPRPAGRRAGQPSIETSTSWTAPSTIRQARRREGAPVERSASRRRARRARTARPGSGTRTSVGEVAPARRRASGRSPRRPRRRRRSRSSGAAGPPGRSRSGRRRHLVPDRHPTGAPRRRRPRAGRRRRSRRPRSGPRRGRGRRSRRDRGRQADRRRPRMRPTAPG